MLARAAINDAMKSIFGHKQDKELLADPTALARSGRLELVARLVVEGFIIGQHKSPFKGTSVEFVEHRQYYPGDEIRHIDWRAYGKTGKYYIKEFEDETNLRCYLLVDASGSMGYGQSTLTKFDYARVLAAALGHVLISQRDAVALRLFDTGIRARTEPSAVPRHFQRLLDVLESATTGGETGFSSVVESIVPEIKRRSLVCIFSDCFDTNESLLKLIQRLGHARHEVVVFRIVAPEEETFPFSSPTQFRNLERSGHNLLTDPHRLRQHYLEQYGTFCDSVEKACASVAVDHVRVLTSEPFHEVLGAWIDSRRRGKRRS